MKSTLIIFARYPRPGVVKTRLGRAIGMKAAAEVYAGFAAHAFSLGKALHAKGFDVRLLHDPASGREEMLEWTGGRFALAVQEGENLGERMSNALAAAFHGGVNAAVLIGTDVPELREAELARSFALLTDRDLVLGPSTDGGYYLIGMKAPLKDLFTGIPWSTDRVLPQTISRAKALGLSFALLPELSDVDTEHDYRAYQARMAAGLNTAADLHVLPGTD